MAAFAPATAQRGGTDPVMLRPEPVVQGEQFGRLLRGDFGALTAGLGGLLGELAHDRVPPLGGSREPGGELRPLGRGGAAVLIGGLPALHYLEHDFFQVRLTAGERDDLGLQVFQLTRGGDLAGVESLPVPVDTAPDLVDVRLCLPLGTLEVTVLGFQGGEGIPQLGVPLLQRAQLFVLGETLPAMINPAEFGIKVGQFEQPQLLLGRCFHGSPR